MERMDSNHLFAVLKAREASGGKKLPHSIPILDHPLLSKHLRKKDNGREYVVEKVLKMWWWGWYEMLLIERNGSHGTFYWKNISCADDSIVARTVREHVGLFEFID